MPATDIGSLPPGGRMSTPSRLARIVIFGLLVALVTPGLAPVAAAPPTPFYALLDLGTLGGTVSYATGINDRGQVVGVTTNAAGATRGFRTTPSAPINRTTDNLGTLGGDYTKAFGLNDAGQVVGNSVDLSLGLAPFRTAPNQPLDPMTDELAARGSATAINNAGQVVGQTQHSGSSNQVPYRTAPGQPYNPATDDLGALFTPCCGAVAYAINVSGQVAGYSFDSTGASFAYRTAPNAPINPSTDSLGSGEAVGINDAGQVVGYRYLPTPSGMVPLRRAFVTAPNGPIAGLLGTFGGQRSAALDINNAGVAVGWAEIADGTRHAFLYAGGVLYDLNTLIPPDSDWDLREANAINDNWQIAGYGVHNGQDRAFLLSPNFADLPPGAPQRDAILQLALRGVIRGYGDGRVGPADLVLRAQSAALIARAVGWDAESWTDADFPDRGDVDDDLWRNVRTLAHYGVALGYADSTYNPTGAVLHQQVILFIARALIAKGAWTERPDTNPYPNLPNATARDQADSRAVATFVYYAGAIPDRPTGSPWPDWDQPASRGWYADVLWRALATLPAP
jgi:probable HAF family extracellular repeat protein